MDKLLVNGMNLSQKDYPTLDLLDLNLQKLVQKAFDRGRKQGSKEALAKKHLAIIPDGCVIVSKKAFEFQKKIGAEDEFNECKVQYYRLTTDKFLDWLNHETKRLREWIYD
jgi:hypothetical protein